MCNKPPRIRRISCQAACIGAIALAPQALADPIAPIPPAPTSLLVGEMLHIDARRALENERAKTSPREQVMRAAPGMVAYPATVEPPAATLLSIYGVDEQLYADVHVHGQIVTYAAGQTQPIHGHPQVPYRLRTIRLPCVQLQTRHSSLELCLGSKP